MIEGHEERYREIWKPIRLLCNSAKMEAGFHICPEYFSPRQLAINCQKKKMYRRAVDAIVRTGWSHLK